MVIPNESKKTVNSSLDEITAAAKVVIDTILPSLDKICLIGAHLEETNCVMADIALESAQHDLRKAISLLDDVSDQIHAHGDAFHMGK